MTALSKRAQNRLEKETRILAAALKVFADTGYTGASMDQIAAAAGVTKPTLYQYFDSKETLFQSMMAAPRDGMMLAFDTDANAHMVAQLYHFAWRYARTVMAPDFLSLARLIIAESHRFPTVGQTYQASGPDQVLAGLMRFMQAQRDAGRLTFEDTELAAEDFWGLILSAPRNRALHVPGTPVQQHDLKRYIDNGTATFLRAYSTAATDDLARLARLTVPANPA